MHNRQHARGAAAEGAEGCGARHGARPPKGSTAVECRKDAARGRPVRLQNLQGCQVLRLLQEKKYNHHRRWVCRGVCSDGLYYMTVYLFPCIFLLLEFSTSFLMKEK